MLFVNETGIEEVYYNDISLDEVYYNGVLVWKKWIEKTGRLGAIDFSSNLDWFSSPVKMFDKTIIPLEIEAYFYYDYSHDEDSPSTSTGLFVSSNGITLVKEGRAVGRPSNSFYGGVYKIAKEKQLPIDRYNAGGGGGTAHGTQRITACITKWLEGGS